MLIDIDTKLINQISEYCSLNEIERDKFIYDLLNKQFLIEKYGERPGSVTPIEVDENNNNRIKELLEVYRNSLVIEDINIFSLNKEEEIVPETKATEFDNGVIMVNIDKPKVKRKRQLK